MMHVIYYGPNPPANLSGPIILANQTDAQIQAIWDANLAVPNFCVVIDVAGARKHWTAPIVYTPGDVLMTKDAFIDYCSAQFGGGTTGPARFGAIIVAMRGSQDATVAYAISKYDAITTVTKGQAQKFFQAARAAAIPAAAVVTNAEISAIVTNWTQV